MTKEVMKQALNVLLLVEAEMNCEYGVTESLRQAIAEAKKQDEPVAYINVEQRKIEWAKYTSWETPTVVNLPKIPLYTTPPAASDLLNALKRIVDEPNNTMSDGKALKEIIRIARLAIAKATGEQP